MTIYILANETLAHTILVLLFPWLLLTIAEKNKLKSRLYRGLTYLHKMKHRIILAVSGRKVSVIKMPSIIVGNVYVEDLATLKFILKTINKNK